MDYESALKAMKKRHRDEMEMLKKNHDAKRLEHEKAKKEGIEVLTRRIEKLENELELATNKQRSKILYRRKTSMANSRDFAKMQRSNQGEIKTLENRSEKVESRNEKVESRNEFIGGKVAGDIITDLNDDNLDNLDLSQKMVSSEFDEGATDNEGENQFDMTHSLNRNVKRKNYDENGGCGHRLKSNLNQSLANQLHINVNKSLDSLNRRNPLVKRRNIPTAVTMPLTARRQVQPGEFASLKLPPLNAHSQAKKVIKSVNRSYRLNHNYT